MSVDKFERLFVITHWWQTNEFVQKAQSFAKQEFLFLLKGWSVWVLEIAIANAISHLIISSEHFILINTKI